MLTDEQLTEWSSRMLNGTLRGPPSEEDDADR
jgi:hypothetical protein